MSTINTEHKNILEDDATDLNHGSKEGTYINELQQEYSMNDDLLNDNIEVYDDVVKNYENNLSKYFQNITDRPSLNNLEDAEYIIDDEYVDKNLSNIDSIDDSNENIDGTEKFLQQKSSDMHSDDESSIDAGNDKLMGANNSSTYTSGMINVDNKIISDNQQNHQVLTSSSDSSKDSKAEFNSDSNDVKHAQLLDDSGKFNKINITENTEFSNSHDLGQKFNNIFNGQKNIEQSNLSENLIKQQGTIQAFKNSPDGNNNIYIESNSNNQVSTELTPVNLQAVDDISGKSDEFNKIHNGNSQRDGNLIKDQTIEGKIGSDHHMDKINGNNSTMNDAMIKQGVGNGIGNSHSQEIDLNNNLIIDKMMGNQKGLILDDSNTLVNKVVDDIIRGNNQDNNGQGNGLDNGQGNGQGNGIDNSGQGNNQNNGLLNNLLNGNNQNSNQASVDEIVGTDSDETIQGTNGNDIIKGLDGQDKIYGGQGDDIIYGGDDIDEIYGDIGDDILVGGSGDDTIYAGLGNDEISGGAGNDILFGQYGDNVIYGDNGDDIIYSGIGNDKMYGGNGKDTFYEVKAGDQVYGEAHDDNFYYQRTATAETNVTIDGGTGHDTIYLDSENNWSILFNDHTYLVNDAGVIAGNALPNVTIGADSIDITGNTVGAISIDNGVINFTGVESISWY